MDINFIMRTTGRFYNGVLASMIDPVIPYLDVYNYAKTCSLSGVNVHFFRENKYCERVGFSGTNVFISHGLADKNWRRYKLVKKFNYICVSGMLWHKKMISEGAPKDKILVTGYTKLDPIFKGEVKKQKNSRKTVLYAPTHNLPGWTLQKRVSIYEYFSYFLLKLSDCYNVVFSPHPANSNKVTLQELANADVVISDCSSIVYEAWALNIPVVFPDWIVKKSILETYKNSFEEHIYKGELGYHAKKRKDFLSLIKTAIEKGIDKRTKNFIEGIFPAELRGCSGKVTAMALKNIK